MYASSLFLHLLFTDTLGIVRAAVCDHIATLACHISWTALAAVVGELALCNEVLRVEAVTLIT